MAKVSARFFCFAAQPLRELPFSLSERGIDSADAMQGIDVRVHGRV